MERGENAAFRVFFCCFVGFSELTLSRQIPGVSPMQRIGFYVGGFPLVNHYSILFLSRWLTEAGIWSRGDVIDWFNCNT